ncbi:calcium-independent phospholipase A2-gamma isoform X1 [Coregonus clupeaformis]|uniref:calcium-independent phospholipase A2-gamma isoform X1 n=1 Tax=Coregonus clupeaformis TaxID=59861 RepID=UPI001E1C4C79|nr:calcium-independent phospholipase A2-gamma isoform X1 [Coregonus clupeaformis]XP_041728328.2 calcium-independent phospholipase A2-gamma isoform X1 [Coregonus clupeaformis]
MSRIRSTLNTVSKAVSGTDLLSKISRLKPSAAVAHAEKVLAKAEPPTPSPTPAASDASAATAMKPPEQDQTGGLEQNNGEEVKENHPLQALEKPFMANVKPKHSLTASVAKSTASSSSAVAKQTLQLFHPEALSTNMDETYSTLAQHVNDYFGSSSSLSTGDDKKPHHLNDNAQASTSSKPALNQRYQSTKSGDHIPVSVPVAAETEVIQGETATPRPTPPLDEVSPTSGVPTRESPASDSTSFDPATTTPTLTPSKKGGFGQYLSDPRPNVQAFFGSYIAPLVPSKFRAEAKSVTAAVKGKTTEEAVRKPGEKTETEEEKKNAEERAKKLLLSQREKIIARVSMDNRTRALVQGIQKATDVNIHTSRVEELSMHLLEYPETRGVAVKERVIPCLLRLRQTRDPRLQAAVREALALVGYTDPVKGRGIRILAIDGGGTRGLVALLALHKLQTLTGKPIYQLFDYICGVSTGAILAFMLGVFQIPLDDCEELYRKLGSDVFKQNVIVGTVKMGWSHAFYDSQIWENILKERMGEGLMVETARDPKCPKVSAVSTIVNRGLPLKAYVFRNYNMLPGVRSHYIGDCKHKMWQAIRASSAAPGYFQEYTLGKDLHQDGGLLINNPTALAIHECKLLWPNTPVQCVVSLGTGRYETASKNNSTYTSLKAKITNVISSATDTEEVHIMLDALLPPDTYFRFNPYMSEDIPLDESRPERLTFLQEEGTRYLERNEAKLNKAASVLALEKSAIQRLAEWCKLKADMYEGLPFISKL